MPSKPRTLEANGLWSPFTGKKKWGICCGRAAYLDFLIAEGIGGRLARAIVVAWARLRSRRRLRRLHKDGRISCGKPSSLFSR